MKRITNGIVVVAILLLCITSCGKFNHTHNNKDTANVNKGNVTQNNVVSNTDQKKANFHKKSFFDSVLSKSYLSSVQIKTHLNIDSFYITPDSKFQGDTIYFANSNYPIVIIDSFVPTCGYKFITVFKRGILMNTSYKLGETSCDEDESANYSRLTYKFTNDKAFYTEETYYERKAGHKTKVTLTDKYYRIDQDGNIDLLKTKTKEVPYKPSDDDE